MGKYSRNAKPLERSYLNREIHPIWRGVGCALMVLVPIQAYFLGIYFFDENIKNRWIVFPPSFYLKDLPDPNLLIKGVIMLAIALVLYAILTFFVFIIMRAVAPPRYGPLDVPPVTYKGRQYKR
jgi:hypothetical protein